MDLVQLTGRPREHLEFRVDHPTQKKLVTRNDQSDMTITAEGIAYVETHKSANPRHLRLAETR